MTSRLDLEQVAIAVPAYIFKANFMFRISLEIHVQPGEATLLWRTGPAKQDPPREVPKLQVQAPAETHVHRGWQEAPDWGVQATDALPEAGDETVLHCWVRSPEWSPTLPFPGESHRMFLACVFGKSLVRGGLWPVEGMAMKLCLVTGLQLVACPRSAQTCWLQVFRAHPL